MLHNILLGVSSYCEKYEVFDLEMTLTLVFDLEVTLSFAHPMSVPFTLQQPSLPVPFIPLTTPCYPIPRRTTPFAGTLHPYYPVPRTTPFVRILRTI